MLGGSRKLGRNLSACGTCRLRKKNEECRPEPPDGVCAKCRELNIECLRLYDAPVPPEFRDKRVVDRLSEWNRTRSNRLNPKSFSLTELVYALYPTRFVRSRAIPPAHSQDGSAAGPDNVVPSNASPHGCERKPRGTAPPNAQPLLEVPWAFGRPRSCSGSSSSPSLLSNTSTSDGTSEIASGPSSPFESVATDFEAQYQGDGPIEPHPIPKSSLPFPSYGASGVHCYGPSYQRTPAIHQHAPDGASRLEPIAVQYDALNTQFLAEVAAGELHSRSDMVASMSPLPEIQLQDCSQLTPVLSSDWAHDAPINWAPRFVPSISTIAPSNSPAHSLPHLGAIEYETASHVSPSIQFLSANFTDLAVQDHTYADAGQEYVERASYTQHPDVVYHQHVNHNRFDAAMAGANIFFDDGLNSHSDAYFASTTSLDSSLQIAHNNPSTSPSDMHSYGAGDDVSYPYIVPYPYAHHPQLNNSDSASSLGLSELNGVQGAGMLLNPVAPQYDNTLQQIPGAGDLYNDGRDPHSNSSYEHDHFAGTSVPPQELMPWPQPSA